MSSPELIAGLTGLILIAFFAIIVAMVAYIILPRRTKRYRQDLSNLYVAGRIRQVAVKHGVNIAQEYEDFKRFVKKTRMEDYSLDQTIEEELKDEITDSEKGK